MPSRGSRTASKAKAAAPAPAEPEKIEDEPSGLAQLISLLGSLQLALILLATASTLLLTGTFLESWYGAAVASQLIYQAWWFPLLLALLAVNITCAALKKWPWKRHQTGFLITHVGLLTLLTGGALSAGLGTSGMLLLVDSAEIASPGFGAVADDQLLDRRRDTLRLRRQGSSGEEAWEADFAPGWIPWNEAGLKTAGLNPAARALAWLAEPGSPARRWQLGDIEIEIVEYAPQADWEPLRAGAADAPRNATFPAARFSIESPMAGKLPAEWIGDHEELREVRLGPGLVLWLSSDANSQQLEEFGRAPAPAEKSGEGEFVMGWGEHRWRWPVAELRGAKAAPLADGWELASVKYQADVQRTDNARPVDPALSFELRPSSGGAIGLVTSARRAGSLFPLVASPAPARLPPGFWVWYHPPDPAYADPSLRGLMHFAQSHDGTLWMRSLHRDAAGERWIAEPSLPVKADSPPLALWPAMQGSFRLEEFLPSAEAIPHCRPRERVGESEQISTPPAIRVRLARGAARQEVWLPRRAGIEVVVPLGGELVGLTYMQRREPLGFTVELEEARLMTEAASGMPERQASELLFRESGGGATQGVTTFNEPFVYRGYKFYQGQMQPAGRDAQGKPLHRSVLLVGYDPGVWLKYAGSLLVTAGIVCMFWMKAYFFGSWWETETPPAEGSTASAARD